MKLQVGAQVLPKVGNDEASTTRQAQRAEETQETASRNQTPTKTCRLYCIYIFFIFIPKPKSLIRTLRALDTHGQTLPWGCRNERELQLSSLNLAC